MTELRHEAVLAAAMLAVLKANNWMAMPLDIDSYRAVACLGADGGIRVERDQAVAFARQFMDRASEAEGWEMPEFSESDERALVDLLGAAYDHLRLVVPTS